MSILKANRIENLTTTDGGISVDNSGRVLMGTTTEGQSDADDLTVASSGATGITVRSGTSNTGNLYFSDGTSGNSEFRGYVQYNHTDNALLFGANAGVKGRFISGGGLCFGTDSADANALDDYEEGVFTPTDASGAGLTFTTAAAVYTKIGRMVYTQFRVVYPSTSNGTAAAIGGFPFPPSNGGAAISNGSNASGVGYATSTAIPQIHMSASETKTNFFNGTAAMSNANFSTRELRFGVVYITAT